MRAKRPMAARGASTIRWEPVRQKTYSAVDRRAGGHCEYCGASNRERPMEHHHVDGRGDDIRESLAMVTLLCCAHSSYGLGCHEKFHRHIDGVDDAVRWSAAERLAGSEHQLFLAEMRGEGWDALDALHRLIDVVENEERA